MSSINVALIKKHSLNKNGQLLLANKISNPIKLSSAELMDKIIEAINNRQPLSVVSVGATEAFVMAQYTIFSEQEFMEHREAFNANLGEKSGFFHRGVRFPNISARDDTVAAVKKADIVGYNIIVNDPRVLTERVFNAYNITPKYIFEANLRRVFMFSQVEKFEEMLRNKKVLLIGSLAPQAKIALENELQSKLGFIVVGAVPLYEYEDLPMVKTELANYDFDLCLIGAGVNATILAPYIAETYGKVAFDIGWGINSLITGEIQEDEWISELIGINTLLQM